MAVWNDLGAALTGGQPQVQQPTFLDDVGGALADPRIMSALMSFGLQAMQPVAIGQTAGGHFGQALGAAGEGLARSEQLEQKSALADMKLQEADRKADLAERALDIRERKSTGRKIGGLTDLVRTRFSREDERRFESQLARDAAAEIKRADKAVADAQLTGGAVDPKISRFAGKTQSEVRDMLRAERRPAASTPSPAVTPTNDDDDDDTDPVVAPSAAVEIPPVPGAIKSNLGWVIPDPQNPGKYKRVR